MEEKVVLMTALTKGGKTTIAMALCPPDCREKMLSLNNCRTEVTVDWTYDPHATGITLEKIVLNDQKVFGCGSKEEIDCETFSKVLDSKEGKYLSDMFGLEKQEDLAGSELEKYVLDKVENFRKNCDDSGLAEIIKNRLSNRFLRRIKVSLPLVDEFARYFKEKDIMLVLRDTRGLLDMDPEEAKEIPSRTMQDLGIDGIDAVLLLGTSSSFPDTTEWYKNAYQSAFESVPVFIMTRSDSVGSLYQAQYGEAVDVRKAQAFLKAVKEEDESVFAERKFAESIFAAISAAYLQCYRLLEKFGVGEIENGDFRYHYEVYESKDLRYVYPLSPTLLKSGESPDYDADDYQLYERMVFENLKDMIGKVTEHDDLMKAIDDQIKTDFAKTLTFPEGTKMLMYPAYNKYTREAVCHSILDEDQPILGPRAGITTEYNGEILYLGAVTSAVSAREWLRSRIARYTCPDELLKNPDGSDMVPDMPKVYRNNLVRKALFKMVEKYTDYEARFRGYYFINRDVVRGAIYDIRDCPPQGDDLNNVSLKIAGTMFPGRQQG